MAGKKDDTIYTAPTGTPPGQSPSTGPSSSSSNSSSGGGGKKSGGGYDPYAAMRRAQRKADRKAAKRYMEEARTLNSQIDALMRALNPKNGAFRRALRQQLANVGLVLRQQDREIMQGYRERVGSLKGAFEDNEAATSDQTSAAATNALRERANALSEATLQGAGETDMLRSQLMSLRNWEANQSEIQRSSADTLRSINTALTDLNVDTATARTNLATEANADREQLWTNYFNRRSEAYTQLGNTLYQQASLYGYAKELAGMGGKQQKRANKRMDDAYDAATREAGKAWKNPGIPAHLRRWKGREDFETTNNAARFENAPTNVSLDRPEGATLRSWSQ